MSRPLTVTLPSDIETSVRQLSIAEGISPEQLVNEAIRQHLFLRRFRSLRERMVAKAAEHGIQTDEDVFERMS